MQGMKGIATTELATIDAITRTVIAAAFKVQNTLGCGFLEKLYERAMVIELTQGQLKVQTQVRREVAYRGESVGLYVADLVVAERVLVEIKACEAPSPASKAQRLNYLKAFDLPVALLLNFGNPRVEVRRFWNRFQRPPTNFMRDAGDERDENPVFSSP
jgi:GxxExxY protein